MTGAVTGNAAAPDHNIGADGIRFRAFFGVLFFFFALGLMALVTVIDAPVALRAIVFVPAWISAFCLLQAQSGVCVFLAARGACTTDMGTQRIDDDDRRLAFVRRAGRIQLLSLLAAAMLTVFLVALSLLLPWKIPPPG